MKTHQQIAEAVVAAHPHLNVSGVLHILQTLGSNAPQIISVLQTILGEIQAPKPAA